MSTNNLQNEWHQLLEKYGIEELQRWFVNFRGYKINRLQNDFETIKETLKDLVICKRD